MTKQQPLSTEPNPAPTPHYYGIQTDDEIDLGELFSALWQRKWIIVLTTMTFAIGAIVYAIHLPNIYKSDVLLAPADSSGNGSLSQMASQLGGLASLAGISLKNGQTSQTDLAIQVIKSRQFIAHFINKHNLLVPIMAVKGWDLASNTLIYNSDIYDVKKNKWLRTPKGLKGIIPSTQEAYKTFIKDILSVSQDEKTGLYNVSVSFYSPYVAKKWASWLVQDINNIMRNRAIAETTQNLNYLQEQLKKTAVADMQKTFYKLIEEQTKKQMLAEVQEEFVFRVVDPAVVPEVKSKPNRALIVILGTILGSILSIIIILVYFSLKKESISLKDKI